jgi:hypothetical protein
VLWDTTSTYFEGRAAAGFAEFGHSKHHRSDRVQIVVGALMSRDGFPIAHEVFPGNTADIDTFRHTLGKVRERSHLGRVILVGDRGMVSERLLGEIEALGLGYIVGGRIRRFKAAEAALARAGRYREVAPNLRVKEVVHGEARYSASTRRSGSLTAGSGRRPWPGSGRGWRRARPDSSLATAPTGGT